MYSYILKYAQYLRHGLMKASQAKPCCQAPPTGSSCISRWHLNALYLSPSPPPTGSPCISRCHLKAYGHLYLSPSTPHPRGSEAKPSQAMLPTPPVKSPCIATRLPNAYGNMYRSSHTTTSSHTQIQRADVVSENSSLLNFAIKMCLKIPLVSS